VIAPSLLSADFARLADEAERVADADWLHVDVMGAHFVPNLTLGLPVVEAIGASTDLPLDCHLMIENPERWAPGYAEAGAQRHGARRGVHRRSAGRGPQPADGAHAGVARVVIGIPEATELAGGGAQRLRDAGIDVRVGVEQEAAEEGALAAWLTGVREHRPYVVWKVAGTLDGRVAAADGSSRWITGPDARAAGAPAAGCRCSTAGSPSGTCSWCCPTCPA
jgi:hypothetical protein